MPSQTNIAAEQSAQESLLERRYTSPHYTTTATQCEEQACAASIHSSNIVTLDQGRFLWLVAHSGHLSKIFLYVSQLYVEALDSATVDSRFDWWKGRLNKYFFSNSIWNHLFKFWEISREVKIKVGVAMRYWRSWVYYNLRMCSILEARRLILILINKKWKKSVRHGVVKCEDIDSAIRFH